MNNIIDFNRNYPDISYYKRKTTEGPENNLVDIFLFYLLFYFDNIQGGIAFFKEPRLETGFPDMVFVQYEPKGYDTWNDKRINLSNNAIKILHHLHLSKTRTTLQICEDLGYLVKDTEEILEQLKISNLVMESKGHWKTHRLEKIFAIKRIIAIEAKIYKWKDALRQAQNNKWFASEVYILSNIQLIPDELFSCSKKEGIGVLNLGNGSIKRLVKPQLNNLPNSYASWLINEWIGRYLFNYT